MSRIIVRLNGRLEQYSGCSPRVELFVAEDATLATVQGQLGIPKGGVALFVVDRQVKTEDTTIQDGWTVDLYPMFGGG